jgi:phytoene dehydrogenase-like protein
VRSLDIAVVGSGIGGALISALQKDKELVLFEKDKNLGGCASTFKRGKSYYNSGATTFVGYEDGHIIKDILDRADVKPNIKKSHIAIRVIQDKRIVDRVKDFDQFIEQIDRAYPHKNNRIFWSKIKDIDEKFWQIRDIYFAKHSLNHYIKSLSFAKKVFDIYGFDLLKSASSYIDEILTDISDEYRAFIDAQLLITVQTKSENISLLSLALGLSYPFHDVYYAMGGMGSLIDDIVDGIEVAKKEQITKIIKETNGYRLISNHDEYKANSVILNSSIYQSANLFDDKDIKRYYDSFEFSDQSAFVIYLRVDSKEEFLHHYQIIEQKEFFHAISNSYFVSFSDKDDEKMSKNGYSVTISTHTLASDWICDSKEIYEARKNALEYEIMESFYKHFESICKDDIKDIYSATSYTFNRYISRYNCGGKAINLSTLLQLPSNNTPFDGLYNIGDTTFAGQGWPGVAIGVDNLNRIIDGK